MKTYTILIIEDNPITSKMLRVALLSRGYVVLEADTGSAAIELLEMYKPDMILQDMLLPDMEGIELNNQLRALPNGKTIPIIAISGFLSRIEEMQNLHDGFTSYIIKPISPTSLLTTVKKYLPLNDPEIINTSPTNPNKRPHALIADDDHNQLKLLSHHLKQAGFTVTEAVNGQLALMRALEDPPDIIVSDILMPAMDGFDLSMQVRLNPLLQKIPVILLSSHYIEKSDIELAKQSGCTAFYERDDNFPVLIKNIKTILENTPVTNEVSSDKLFTAEHIARLHHQIEVQQAANTKLTRLASLQAAQLTLLKSISDAMINNNDINTVTKNLLSLCLDAAGISKGVLYLIDQNTGNMALKSYVGYPQEQEAELADCFGILDALSQLMDKHHTIQIPSTEISHELSRSVLSLANVKSALIVPLLSIDGSRGILFLGSRLTNFVETDLEFAHALGSHIAHTVTLAETFDRLVRSEKRYRMLMECVNCAIVLHDEKGIILESNHQSEDLFGKSRGRIIGGDFNDFISINDKQKIKKVLDNLTADKNTYSGSCKIKNGEGHLVDAHISVSSVQIGDEHLFLTALSEISTENC